VRQLRGAIERLVVLCEGEHIDFDDLPDELLASIISRDQAAMPALEGALTLEQHVQRLILDILAETGGNVTEAARRLGIGRSTLYRKLKRLPESATTGVP
jgi:sigma-54 dependent transcriptional regulator, acetoin dehydrogenase operon transcriptional activator AcoR